MGGGGREEEVKVEKTRDEERNGIADKTSKCVGSRDKLRKNTIMKWYSAVVLETAIFTAHTTFKNNKLCIYLSITLTYTHLEVIWAEKGYCSICLLALIFCYIIFSNLILVHFGLLYMVNISRYCLFKKSAVHLWSGRWGFEEINISLTRQKMYWVQLCDIWSLFQSAIDLKLTLTHIRSNGMDQDAMKME